MPIAKEVKLFDIDNQAKNIVREDDEAFAFRVLARLDEDANGCWNWTGAVGKRGYGIITWGGHGQIWSVHRLTWGAFRGKAPNHLQLDHLCRNKICANPEHLELVTGKENARRHHAFKTHCAQGHLWIAENISISNRGWKFCRLCANQRAKNARLNG